VPHRVPSPVWERDHKLLAVPGYHSGMPTVRDAMSVLEQIAPLRHALGWDRVGLQVGDPGAELSHGVLSLDSSLAAAEFARAGGAQLLVAHHPLLFQPAAAVTTEDAVGRTLLLLASSGIAFYAAHTNWDAAKGGVNDVLAKIFGLQSVRPFGGAAEVGQTKLVFFCPPADVDAVVDALSEAGAGVIGLYERCAFMHPGTGTFLASPEANPAVGQTGRVERVEEIRVEMVLPADRAGSAAAALVGAHPYEEPAYDLFPLAPRAEQPAGRIGELGAPLPLAALADTVDESLATRCWAWGDPDLKVRKLAIVGGAADSEWRAAQAAGADALLTGEVKQHVALEASEQGFALIAAGHYATEQPAMAALRDLLAQRLPSVTWVRHEPARGWAGRPL
jgi:dinuclear metal center YbgI/SA1388 family protein